MGSLQNVHMHSRFVDMVSEARALVAEAGWAVLQFRPSSVVLMRDDELLTISCHLAPPVVGERLNTTRMGLGRVHESS